MTRITFFCAIFAFLGGYAHSEECDPSTQTLTQCQALLGGAAAGAADQEIVEIRNEVKGETARDLSITTTGDVALNALGTSVSLNDLLPLLNLAVTPVSSDDAQTAGITVEYSPTKRIWGGDLKAGLRASTPSVSDTVRSALADSADISEVESAFDYGDDVEISVTYAFEGSIGSLQIGRTDYGHDDLLDGMFDAANASAESTGVVSRDFFGPMFRDIQLPYRDHQAAINDALSRQTINELKATLEQLNRLIFADFSARSDFIAAVSGRAAGNTPLATTFRQCVLPLIALSSDAESLETERAAISFAACTHDGILQAVQRGSQLRAERTAALSKVLIGNGFFKLASLVNNQPQLLFSASARFRDDLAGGDQYGAKLSFEFDMSGQSINGLRKYLSRQRCTSGFEEGEYSSTTFKDCAPEILSYVNQNSARQGGWRGSVNVEYLRRPSITADLPNVMTPFTQDESKSLIASVVLGRQFQLLENSNLPKAKLDFSVSYDDVSSDPMRQSRVLGNMTFTQQLADATQLSVGLVWANKPEFRGDVDEEFGARIGLNYKFGTVD